MRPKSLFGMREKKTRANIGAEKRNNAPKRWMKWKLALEANTMICARFSSAIKFIRLTTINLITDSTLHGEMKLNWFSREHCRQWCAVHLSEFSLCPFRWQTKVSPSFIFEFKWKIGTVGWVETEVALFEYHGNAMRQTIQLYNVVPLEMRSLQFDFAMVSTKYLSPFWERTFLILYIYYSLFHTVCLQVCILWQSNKVVQLKSDLRAAWRSSQ